MIVTARQLEDLHRAGGANGQITLPYRARLSPLAQDWVRERKVTLGYSDVEEPASNKAAPVAPVSGLARHGGCGYGEQALEANSACKCDGHGGFLWWCDGPCGPAKAALTTLSKESILRPLDAPADAKRIIAVVKSIASDVKANRASGGILLVQNGAVATVYANRCPSLRAVLGTCLEAVEQGVQQVAANVLIVEYPYKTLQQTKNMLSRFVRAKPGPSDDVKRQLQELATCG